MNGDKHPTLFSLFTLAMGRGMIRAGIGMMPANEAAQQFIAGRIR
jgi:hypothetical protein